MTTTPSVAVVIPTYRRLNRIGAVAEAYLAQDAAEVIVVLDGPHPGWQSTLDAHADPRLRVIELAENVGLARARIAGLREVRSDVVLAVDDDVDPSPELVERHRAHHRGREDTVLQGYMPVALPVRRGRDDSPTFVYARDYERQVAVWRGGSSRDILGSLWGGNVSIPRRLYERAEELLPSIRIEYNEDLDLGMRLDRLGAIASFDPAASAVHRQERGIEPYLAECVRRGGAIRDLEARWGERPAQLTPLVVIARDYGRVRSTIQRQIASRDSRGMWEKALLAAYRVSGLVRAWRTQDALTRFLRRALIMRGYRQAGARASSTAITGDIEGGT